jgi:hypothetical protein
MANSVSVSGEYLNDRTNKWKSILNTITLKVNFVKNLIVFTFRCSISIFHNEFFICYLLFYDSKIFEFQTIEFNLISNEIACLPFHSKKKTAGPMLVYNRQQLVPILAHLFLGPLAEAGPTAARQLAPP